MTDRRGFEDLEDVESRLRRAFAREADEVRPDDRLADIRAALSPATRRRPWLAPLAAAAAVAVIAVGAWVVLRPTGATPPPVPASPTTTVGTPSPTASPSESPTGSPTGSTTATASVPPQTVAVALPVFYVAQVDNGQGFGLVREFRQMQVPQNASLADKANVALQAAVEPVRQSPNTYQSPWPDGTVATFVDLPKPELGVQLSNPGKTGLPAELQRLAVQALVWTVTGVFQQDAPVPVVVRTGGNIFESVPSNVFKRPAPSQQFQEIAPIWVDSPYAGQALAATKPVVVSGQACTFEANVRYQLRQGGAVVKDASTTASSGCPQQGSWTIDLGTLAPGTYELRVIDVSQKDGSIAFQNIVPFTVG
jgi:hypothetical protein